MKNTKNNILKKWWFWLIIILLLILLSTGTETQNENNSTISNISTNLTENVTNIEETQKTIYYEDDETINKYITQFNNMYPENKITNNMLSVYHHHGSDHKDQVKFTMDNLEILLTANYKNSISINIDNSNNDNVVIKSLIKKFVKVFNSSITDENVDKYIDEQGVGSNIDTYDNIEYWTNKDGNGDRIIYIKITGKLK